MPQIAATSRLVCTAAATRLLALFCRCDISHEFKPVWIRGTDHSDKICPSDNDFHMSHEAICCSNWTCRGDVSRRFVASCVSAFRSLRSFRESCLQKVLLQQRETAIFCIFERNKRELYDGQFFKFLFLILTLSYICCLRYFWQYSVQTNWMNLNSREIRRSKIMLLFNRRYLWRVCRCCLKCFLLFGRRASALTFYHVCSVT